MHLPDDSAGGPQRLGRLEEERATCQRSFTPRSAQDSYDKNTEKNVGLRGVQGLFSHVRKCHRKTLSGKGRGGSGFEEKRIGIGV